MLSKAVLVQTTWHVAQESGVPSNSTEACGPFWWLSLLPRNLLHMRLTCLITTMLPLLWGRHPFS